MSTRDSVPSALAATMMSGDIPTLPALPALPDEQRQPAGASGSAWEPSRPATDLRAATPANSDSAAQRLNTTLGGKYRIDRLLGEGGCGRVYLATHLQLRAQVAIKFLLSHWASRPIFRERFRREARALALLSHPGIVRVHDFGDDAGDMYLVMEYVRGQPLSEHVLKDGQPMPPERAADFIDKILEVLQVAHERGIVHREQPARRRNRASRSLADFFTAVAGERLHGCQGAIVGVR